jgi:hypothetical protein
MEITLSSSVKVIGMNTRLKYMKKQELNSTNLDGQPMLERTFRANFDDLQQRREDKINQILND